ncbi:hypothetical protein [Hymenobacter jeollabukensis]|uniref:Uncharacterized protein n=1 Tax=Hymenobacter jeollabukensis TaxID=2025313 RepID=A0A5R8WQ83_9BACT|nr:hypothetical protein [Hymenobacter jeollabukensis]TLM92395.1 hypothetical protein FDY95_13270 [Hymenobacter jeollabukensis]
MTAAFRLTPRRRGYLFVLASLLPMMVALHQLLVLLGSLLDATSLLPRYLLLTGQVLGATAICALLLREGVRRIDG